MIWLLIGHQNGVIGLWDIQSKKLLKSIQVHNSAVLNVKLLKDSRIVSSDAHGILNLVSISKVLLLYVMECVLIVNGNLGKLFNVVPFISIEEIHPIDVYNLVAMTTINKLHIMSFFNNTTTIQFTLERPTNSVNGNTNSIVYCSWRKAKGKPILFVSWGNVLQIIQVEISNQSLKFVKIGEHNFDFEIVGIEWIHSKLIMVLTNKDTLCFINGKTGIIVEAIEFKSSNLVYHTRFSNQSISKYSYNQSIQYYNKNIYLLELNEVILIKLNTWEERISILMSHGKWIDAINITKQWLFDEGDIVPIDLPIDAHLKQELLSMKLNDLLISWLDTLLFDFKGKSILNEFEINNYFKPCITYSILICMLLNNFDFLFSNLFDKIKSRSLTSLFFDLLEPFILNNKIKALNPAIMQLLVDDYKQRNKLEQVEQIIIKLDISSFDFHQVATLCFDYQLFDALIYLYTLGLHDFITPLNQLLIALSNTTTNNNNNNNNNNKSSKIDALLQHIFQYINKHLVNNDNSNLTIRLDIFKFLCEKDNNGNPFRILLLIDKDVDNLVKVFNDYINKHTNVSNEISIINDLFTNLFYRSLNQFPTQTQIKVVDFIVHFIIQQLFDIDNKLITSILNFYLSSNVSNFKNICETSLLQFTIKLQTMENITIDFDKLLVDAEALEYYKIAEYLHFKKKNWNKVLHCRTMDKDYKIDIFNFIRNLMLDSKITTNEKMQIRNSCIKMIGTLITIDAESTCLLIIECFQQDIMGVVNALNSYPNLQFKYLQIIMEKDKQTNNNINKLLKQSEFEITSEMVYLYLKLMCKYAPNEVYKYLITHDNYPLDASLAICQSAGIVDATTYLLERTGDLIGALKLLLVNVDKSVLNLYSFYQSLPNFVFDEKCKFHCLYLFYD